MATRIDVELNLKGTIDPDGGLDQAGVTEVMVGLQKALAAAAHRYVSRHDQAEGLAVHVGEDQPEHPRGSGALSPFPQLAAKSATRIDVVKSPVMAGV